MTLPSRQTDSDSPEEISDLNDEPEPTSALAAESRPKLTTESHRQITRGSLGIVKKNDP